MDEIQFHDFCIKWAEENKKRMIIYTSERTSWTGMDTYQVLGAVEVAKNTIFRTIEKQQAEKK